jgi:hypothetical protein
VTACIDAYMHSHPAITLCVILVACALVVAAEFAALDFAHRYIDRWLG